MITYLSLLVILIVILLVALVPLTLSLSFIFGPPYLPTPDKTIKEMLDLAEISKKDVVIDLGSGDGAVLLAAASRGAKAKGWEINPFLVLLTKIRAISKGLSNKINVYTKPYQKANLKDSTVVFLYCMPKFMPIIETIIRKQAPKNVKIISYKFPLPNFKLIKQTKSGIFLYKL